MTRDLPIRIATVRRFDQTVRALDEARRFAHALGNDRACAIATENRDVARRLHLQAVADALAAGWVLS